MNRRARCYKRNEVPDRIEDGTIPGASSVYNKKPREESCFRQWQFPEPLSP